MAGRLASWLLPHEVDSAPPTEAHLSAIRTSHPVNRDGSHAPGTLVRFLVASIDPR